MNENRFDSKGEVYAESRPNYPDDFINYLYSEVGMTENSVIADVGSGTGILTKPLLQKGSKVYAVEPNDDMRRMAERNLQHFDGFTSVCGTAENTEIPAGSVDFVVVGQAYHWFDRSLFQNECRRILKPSGKILLVWNFRDEKSAIISENAVVNKRYCPNFNGYTEGMTEMENDAEFTQFFVGDYKSKVFENSVSYDEIRFVGRNLSSSYAPIVTDDNYVPYIDALKELFSKFSENGVLIYPYLTRSYIGSV